MSTAVYRVWNNWILSKYYTQSWKSYPRLELLQQYWLSNLNQPRCCSGTPVTEKCINIWYFTHWPFQFSNSYTPKAYSQQDPVTKCLRLWSEVSRSRKTRHYAKWNWITPAPNCFILAKLHKCRGSILLRAREKKNNSPQDSRYRPRAFTKSTIKKNNDNTSFQRLNFKLRRHKKMRRITLPALHIVVLAYALQYIAENTSKIIRL